MKITDIDHIVLTVADIDASVEFYTGVLGMRAVTFGANRTALEFGKHKINLHPAGKEFEPKALQPTPGSADLCLVAEIPIEEIVVRLQSLHIPIIEGPVKRTGARGPIISVYIRDPDGNLIEIARYVS